LCEKVIFDIENMDDKAVEEAVKSDPNICLKVDINSVNIRVVNHDA